MYEFAGICARTLCCAFLALAAALLLTAGETHAQEKLSASQQSGLTQCLVGCKKGDAACQNACTQKTTTADFAKNSGSCVRACADALVGPDQKADQAEDIKKCISACN